MMAMLVRAMIMIAVASCSLVFAEASAARATKMRPDIARRQTYGLSSECISSSAVTPWDDKCLYKGQWLTIRELYKISNDMRMQKLAETNPNLKWNGLVPNDVVNNLDFWTYINQPRAELEAFIKAKYGAQPIYLPIGVTSYYGGAGDYIIPFCTAKRAGCDSASKYVDGYVVVTRGLGTGLYLMRDLKDGRAEYCAIRPLKACNIYSPQEIAGHTPGWWPASFGLGESGARFKGLEIRERSNLTEAQTLAIRRRDVEIVTGGLDGPAEALKECQKARAEGYTVAC